MRKRQFVPRLRNGRMIREGHFRQCACGQIFERKSGNQLHCANCNKDIRYQGLATMEALVTKSKATADLSGNPKVWTAKECSQDFLRSLIPRRIA